jgi:hypothetical protein
MATVPDNFTFGLQDVVTCLGVSGDQVSCVNAAMAVSYDPAYSGEVGLRKFRNYNTTRGISLSISPTTRSGTGSFTLTITASTGLNWNCGSGSYGAWITVNGVSNVNGTGNGSVTINVIARPAGGSGTTGYVSVTSYAGSSTCTITRP